MATVVTPEAHIASPSFPLWSPRAVTRAIGVLASVIVFLELLHPGVIDSYDSGVYYDAAWRLLTGVVPYRDYVFVQPPGITMVLAPAALVGHLATTSAGFWVGRLMSGAVSVINALLVTTVLRSRGRAAMWIGGLAMAVTPVTNFVGTGVKLEPFFMFFVLLGVRNLFARPREVPTRGELLAAGAYFAAAISIKGWAVIPALVAVGVLAPQFRRRLAWLLLSMVLGIGLLFGPFFLLAPGAMWHQIVVEQVTRAVPSVTPVLNRLIDLSGYQGTWLAPNSVTVIVLMLGALVVVVFAARERERDLLGPFASITSVVGTIAIVATPQFFPYYCYLVTPYLAIATALVGSRLVRSPRAHHWRMEPRLARGLLVAGLLSVATLADTTLASYERSATAAAAVATSAIDRYVPAGSCVVYDVVYLGVVTDRLSDSPHCPLIIDSYGMWLGNGNQLVAPPAHFSEQWRRYFAHAQYVVLSNNESTFIPWTPALTTWFQGSYAPLYGKDGVHIFRRLATR
ncbi:MAG: hypothetical protein HKL87_06460 [Acidimicrobiaceae bacterium]|nr:hypothetical protein [Acidimicrobiaceae bacterium]